MEKSYWLDCRQSGCTKKNLFRLTKRGNIVGIWVWCKECKDERWFSIDELLKIVKDDNVMSQITKSSELTREF